MNQLQTNDSPILSNLLQELQNIESQLDQAIQNCHPLLNGERFLTDKELSEKLKISRRTLQEYRNNGQLAFIKLSGKIIYKESDVQMFLDSNYIKQYTFK